MNPMEIKVAEMLHDRCSEAVNDIHIAKNILEGDGIKAAAYGHIKKAQKDMELVYQWLHAMKNSST